MTEKWINTITCAALIKKLASPEQLSKWSINPSWQFEELNSRYLCPDISSLDLAQDPYYLDKGSAFVAVVNRCDIATQVDREHKLTPGYEVSECLDDLTTSEAVDQIESLRVGSKLFS